MLGVCTFVFAAVLAAFLYALWRAPRGDLRIAADGELPESGRRNAARSISLAVAASALLLIFLIVASFATDRALARLPLENALRIEVTANQWWWDLRYQDAVASRIFTTANELHIPVGRPVVLTLKSSDVIHSLWIPNLHGKKDLIPGHTTSLQLKADQPGTYRGQCAEFCGFQHAFMALLVIAEPPAQYEAWAERQRQPASPPTAAKAVQGERLFLTTTCAMCHAIQGTSAAARHAPDLTHVAGRQTIAAGRLANSAADLENWISDPQQYKPGVNMPSHQFAPEDRQALVEYLRGLQ
jgi:cytochrome c oxidase subunit 2